MDACGVCINVISLFTCIINVQFYWTLAYCTQGVNVNPFFQHSNIVKPESEFNIWILYFLVNSQQQIFSLMVFCVKKSRRILLLVGERTSLPLRTACTVLLLLAVVGISKPNSAQAYSCTVHMDNWTLFNDHVNYSKIQVMRHLPLSLWRWAFMYVMP